MSTYGYVELFGHREFRALWTGSALGVAATTMSSLSLATLVFAQTGSSLLTAVTMFGPSLVQVAGATTLMSAADTAPPRPVLTLVSAAMACALAVQAVLDLTPATRLTIVLAAAYVMSIGSGVRWGLLSEVLAPERYALARSAMNVSVGVMQVVGFAVGGTLLHVLNVQQIFWLAAGLAALAVPVTWWGIADHRPRRERRTGMRETWRGNRVLLRLPSTRPLLVALCVPNGLVVGCEALFVPYAGEAAASLFVAGALGMLTGDLVMGRVLTPAQRRQSAGWLRLWLALPFVTFLAHPDIPLAALLVGAATIGYAATLAQQEILMQLTPAPLYGQVLGVDSAARVTCQGLGALLAGGVAELIEPSHAIAALALGSLVVSTILTPALTRAAAAATRSGASRDLAMTSTEEQP
jgi:predicted MFS family arabinose efflux permease